LGSGRAGFAEKSVVRPTYSYMGDFFISDNAISDIVNILAEKQDGVAQILRVTTQTGKGGVEILVLVTMEYGTSLLEAATEFQRILRVRVAEMTAFNVARVDIEIRGLQES
jgi:uncharacterized alkaline shock family protein YloU